MNYYNRVEDSEPPTLFLDYKKNNVLNEKTYAMNHVMI